MPTDSMQLIERGLNSVATVSQARLVIGEALTAIGQAHSFPDVDAAQHRVLEEARKPLQAWYEELRMMAGNVNYKTAFQVRRRLITRAYVEISGITGVLNAKATVSLFNEISKSAGEVTEKLGKGAKEVVGGAGDITGNLLGGLLKGLGPLVLVMLAILVLVHLNQGKAA